MVPAEFDKFAEEYKSIHTANIKISGESPEYFSEYKMKDLKRIVEANPNISGSGPFLDFGSGTGSSVPFFRKHLPNARLTCVDVSKSCLKTGKLHHGSSADFVCSDGVSIPFADNTFEGEYVLCVFHHIQLKEQILILQELKRVLKSKGTIMVYEHNPLNPLTVHTVNNCPFDKNAVLIRAWAMQRRLESAGFVAPIINYRLFFPRALFKIRWMEDWIKWLPLGAQYYISATK